MNVFIPKFDKTSELTPEGRPYYRVELRIGPPLKAETAEKALQEAKALGHIAPIVG